LGGTPLIDDPEATELHAAALAEFIRIARMLRSCQPSFHHRISPTGSTSRLAAGHGETVATSTIDVPKRTPRPRMTKTS
jgi:hypothetical protein